MASPAKILIVDDDMILREMYEARLKEEGYEISVASDGEEAIQKVEKEQPDLIILDIMMPKINGIDVMRKIRSNDAIANIPIILLTALVREIDKVKEMMKEYDSYLIKSDIMPGEVVEKIKAALEKTQS
ncbi:MAG: response regulator [Patescibacteria group bacterium]